MPDNAMPNPLPPPSDLPRFVEDLIARAVMAGASDVHIEPTAAGGDVRFRIDGLLRRENTLTADVAAAVVARLMVMANLLTYRRDVPQEGAARLALPTGGNARSPRLAGEAARRSPAIDLRISIMPTTHGLRAAVRLPAELTQPRGLNGLGLDAPALALIHQFIRTDGGVLAIVGPAGSGKTTLAYAVLEAIAADQPGLSIVSLEDPVERDLPAVTQIQVRPFGELSYAVALRSMLRQDPQVLMLGEVRDSETASIAIQAGLSGHRLVCTLHAADAGQAVARLLEMGLEPYQVAGSLFGVIAQRLVRRKSAEGYAGRVPIGEAVAITEPMRRRIAAKAEAEELRSIYRAAVGFTSMRQAAMRRVESSETDRAEVQRVLGVDASPGMSGGR